MFNTNAGDVITNMGLVLKVLGPMYAILLGLMAVRLLLDMVGNRVFPKPVRTTTKRARQRATFDRKQYPGLQYYRTKKGLTVSWYADDSKRKSRSKSKAK